MYVRGTIAVTDMAANSSELIDDGMLELVAMALSRQAFQIKQEIQVC